MTAGELRKLATYLQWRLDRAGNGTFDLRLQREIVEEIIKLIEEVMAGRKKKGEEHGYREDRQGDRPGQP